MYVPRKEPNSSPIQMLDGLANHRRELSESPFARPDILFHDAHRIDLYRLIYALHLMT